jgi:hypothetical protein
MMKAMREDIILGEDAREKEEIAEVVERTLAPEATTEREAIVTAAALILEERVVESVEKEEGSLEGRITETQEN